jgi:hypothetical protein
MNRYIFGLSHQRSADHQRSSIAEVGKNPHAPTSAMSVEASHGQDQFTPFHQRSTRSFMKIEQGYHPGEWGLIVFAGCQ